MLLAHFQFGHAIAQHDIASKSSAIALMICLISCGPNGPLPGPIVSRSDSSAGTIKISKPKKSDKLRAFIDLRKFKSGLDRQGRER